MIPLLISAVPFSKILIYFCTLHALTSLLAKIIIWRLEFFK